jgi:hypothetical protein
MGLGDVKHHEFSNLHNLKIQDMLCTLKILFSVFCNMTMLKDIFALCVIQVKIQESTVKTPFFFGLSGSGQQSGRCERS